MKDSNHVQVFVQRWNATTEDLHTVTDETELLKWRGNLNRIWREGLTPYRQSAGEDEEGNAETAEWAELTSHISDVLLTRILGNKNDWRLSSASSALRDVDDIPGLGGEHFAAADLVLNVLPIELKQTWRPGATGRERTEAARDHSWALGDLVDESCDGDETQLLGELQFCFLMILTLNSYSCLEQWKRILKLVFTCQAAITERTTFYVKIIRLLQLQLKRSQDAEGGLFDLTEDGAGFLKSILRRFKRNIAEVEGKAKIDVMDELDELEAFLSSNYGWSLQDQFLRSGLVTLDDGERVEMTTNAYDEEDESGEYAPAIVELTDDQLKELGGRQELPRKSDGTCDDEADNESQNLDDSEHESEDETNLEDLDSRY